MKIRFYIDPETERLYIENHGVSPTEVLQVLERPGQDYMGYGGARVALGRTSAGRHLKVIYKLDETAGGIFVITAYPIRGNELKAYRRRLRRKGQQ